MTDNPEHRLSKDGSSTLYSHQFGQYYHNPNGAVSESRHVFFETPGLTHFLKSIPDSCSVFEVGFGTGLNFFLLADYYLKNGYSFPLHFYSVEAYPIKPQLSSLLNFDASLSDTLDTHLIRSVFEDLKPGMNIRNLFAGADITLHLFYGTFDEVHSVDHPADFIFHDPFSPEVNGELWQPATFEKLLGFSHPGVVLSTYCAASSARAAMAKAGWLVSRAPGALGKREMTVSSPDPEKLQHHKRVNETRLIQRLDQGDFR